MVWYIVDIPQAGPLGITNFTRKEAKKALEGPAEPKESEPKSRADKYAAFRKLKWRIELYLGTLKCTVQLENAPEGNVAQGIREYFNGIGKRPCAEIFDGLDPEEIPDDAATSPKCYYKLSDELDNLLADDILKITNDELDYNSDAIGPHRANKIIRRIGADWYIALPALQKSEWKAIHLVTWESDMDVMDFIKTFNGQLMRCAEVDIMVKQSDRNQLFEHQAQAGRKKNGHVSTAIYRMRESDGRTFMARMQVFAGVILEHYGDGKVPRSDEEAVQEFTMMMGLNTSSSDGQRVCTRCHKTGHTAEKCWTNKTCSYCKKKGHIPRICNKRRKDLKAKKKGQSGDGEKTSDGATGGEAAKPVELGMVARMERLEKALEDATGESLFSSIVSMSATSATSGCALRKDGMIVFGVDSMASICACALLEFFETIDFSRSGFIKTLNGRFKYKGYGIIALRFGPTSQVYRFLAVYIPDASMNLLSNFALYKAGIIPDYNPDSPKLTFPEEENSSYPMYVEQRTTRVLVPPPKLSIATTLLTNEDAALWHARTMHMGERILHHLGIDAKEIPTCETCLQTKARRLKPKLDPSLKLVPKRKGEMVAVDLMIPSAKTKTPGGYIAAFVLVDVKTTYPCVEAIKSKTAQTLVATFDRIRLGMKMRVELVVIDRESGLDSKEFLDHLLKQGIRHKLIPRERHGEFNPLAERTIGILRVMARAALFHMDLDDTFWVHATKYAAFLRARLPPARGGLSPYQRWYRRKPRKTSFRVFGCVVYVLKTRREMTNKFLPNTRVGIFMGFAKDATHSTCIVYIPTTKRFIFPHDTDCWFNERLSFKSLQERQTVKLSRWENKSYSKHSKIVIDESSDEDETTGDADQQDEEHGGDDEEEAENAPDTEPDGTGGGTTAEISTSSRGREVRRVNYRQLDHSYRDNVHGGNANVPVIGATVETVQQKYHEKRTRTPGQKQKFLRRLRFARQTNTPMTYGDILGHEEEDMYREAVEKEFTSLAERMVFEKVNRADIPQGVEVGTGIVLVSKKRDGRFKARCVYNGRQQQYRLTPSSSSPTLDEDSLSIALAIAAYRGWSFRTADIETAFLNAPLPPGTSVFMEIPHGHPDYSERDRYVLRIKQNIYGTREAAAIWWDHFCGSILAETDLKQSKFDECVFYAENILLLANVDDLLMLGEVLALNKLLDTLRKLYKCTYTKLNETADYLGCFIRKEGDNITLSQSRYVVSILEEFGFADARGKFTPLPPNSIFQPDPNCRTDFPYSRVLGKLMYLRLTRFEILQAIHRLSKVARAPGQDAVNAMKHCLAYLKYSQDARRIFYKKQNESKLVLLAFTDAEWGSDPSTRKSVSGHFIYLGPSMTVAHSGGQQVVATSSSVAESVEIFNTAKKLQGLRGFCLEIGIKLEGPCVLLTDSLTTVKSLRRSVSSKVKHIAIYLAFIKDMVKRRELRIEHIPRDINVADLQTKQDTKLVFQKLWSNASTPLIWRNYISSSR